MDKLVHLPVYGTVSFEDESLAWDLFQTPEVARLREISLSSVPSAFVPHGQAASRFQHSVGVAHLGRTVVAAHPHLLDHRAEILAACICHDLGSPPFSHVAEVFMYDATGRTHERATRDLLSQGPIADELARYDVDPAAVVSLICGEPHPAGRLVAGCIDVDNLDNSLTLYRSLGQSGAAYDPVKLSAAFTYTPDGDLALDSALLPDLLGWMRTRIELYQLLHSEPILASAALLYRALEFAAAAGEMPAEFFGWDESRAVSWLRHDAGEPTRELMGALVHWHHYGLVYEQVRADPDRRLWSLYEDWRARKRFTDALADAVGARAEQLALYVGVERGAKAIRAPFTGPYVDICEQIFSSGTSRQRLAVFCAKPVRQRHGDRLAVLLSDAVDALADELGEPDSQPHVFF